MDFAKSLKILAIGNSFSEDGTTYLWNIANNYGIKNVVISNLYIGGCSLETHWNNATNILKNYNYFKNTIGTWTTTNNVSILDGLLDEDWDIITIQQVSGKSGLADSFNPFLSNLIDYVQKNKINQDAKLGWHLTWAYEGTSSHGAFAQYDRNQITMYHAIVNAVQSHILNIKDIEFVIPAGTAIQNARTSLLGDTLTRDGFHLDLNLGRYIAALTWFKAITGFSIDHIEYKPSVVTNIEVEIAKESVNNSIGCPYKITQSEFILSRNI
jgi:hypothetical protein